MKSLTLLLIPLSLNVFAIEKCPDNSEIKERIDFFYVKCASGKMYEIIKGTEFEKKDKKSDHLKEIDSNTFETVKSLRNNTFKVTDAKSPQKKYEGIFTLSQTIKDSVYERESNSNDNVLSCLDDLTTISTANNVISTNEPKSILTYGYKDGNFGKYVNLDGELQFLNFSGIKDGSSKTFDLSTAKGSKQKYYVTFENGKYSTRTETGLNTLPQAEKQKVLTSLQGAGEIQKAELGSEAYRSSLEKAVLKKAAGVKDYLEKKTEGLKNLQDYDPSGVKEIASLIKCKTYFENSDNISATNFIASQLNKFENYTPPKITPLKKVQKKLTVGGKQGITTN